MADTNENVVTEPLLLDSTGRDIADSLAAMAAERAKTIVSDWDNFSALSKSGRAKNFCNIGDIFTDKWTDTANNNTAYDYDWRVVDNGKSYEDVSGNNIPGVMLETKYTHPFGVQFSHAQAFLACAGGLPAATYHFTLGSDWGAWVKKGKTYQFTLTKDVAKGGRIAGCYGAPNQNPTGWKFYVYNADGITQAETGSVTEGSDGIDLGTMKYDSHTDGVKVTVNGTAYTSNMNSIQEMAYGHNRWKTSALRQYMNSDQTKGNWWTPQTEFDIAPDQLASKDGMLCGMPKEFLNNIRTVKVIMNANNVQDKSEQDITYDKFFPLSLEQTYIAKQASGEGEACEYYKQLNGTATPWAWYKDTPELRRYSVAAKTSAQYCRLRSAVVDSADSTWLVNPSGGVGINGASGAYVFLLACVI